MGNKPDTADNDNVTVMVKIIKNQNCPGSLGAKRHIDTSTKHIERERERVMRRCRKLISMIVMMAMLATMTPYQALATETPTDPAVQETQPVVEEEGQQDTEEAIPEVQDASKDEQKEPEESNEAAPSEASSEVAPGSDAVDSSSTNTDVKPAEDEKPEENETPEESTASEPAGTVDNLVLKLGDSDELELKIDGSFAADTEITLKEMEEDDVSEQKDRMTELLKKKVDSLQGVLLMDKNGEPAILRQNGMTLTVRGSMLPEEGLVFAFLDEEGEMKIVSDFEKSDTDDGVCYKFTADSVAALFVASAKTAYPAFAVENVAVAGTDITISVDAPEGAFPEGIQMRVSLKETPEAVLEAANAELAEEVAQETKTEESVEAARAKVTKKDAVTFNIEFYLPDDPETEIEPLVPISVTFGNIALDGDTLEVYHSDDSQEGEVQVEKVLDGVENTDVLTVNGLEKFSDYTVLAVPARGDAPFELQVQVTPSGDSAFDLTEEGVTYTSNDRAKTYSVHFYVKYPTASNKELEIQLPYGMTWAETTAYQWAFDHHSTETWFGEVERYIRPEQQTDPAKREISGFPGVDTGHLRNGALTIKWKEGLESAEFTFNVSTVEKFWGQTGLSLIEDAILVSLSYDDEVKAVRRMHLQQPDAPFMVGKLVEGNLNYDDQKRIMVLENTDSKSNVNWYASPNRTTAYVLKDDYAIWLETPEGLEWVRNSGRNNGNDYKNLDVKPTLHVAGETLELSDGSTYTIPEGKQVYCFSKTGKGRAIIPYNSTWGTFFPIWHFPVDKFPAGTEVPIRMLDARLKYWGSDHYESFDRATLPEQKYIIQKQVEEVFVNIKYDSTLREGYIADNDLSFGAGVFKYTQEATAGNFVLGNREIGDSRPRVLTYTYDTKNTGAAGITEQVMYGYNNHASFGTTKLTNIKAKLWIPGDPGSETEWIDIAGITGGTLRMTEVPGWEEGYYLRQIQCEVDRIPAQSVQTNNFFGVELTDEVIPRVNWGRFESTLVVSDLPGGGFNDEIKGRTYTGLTAKMIIPADCNYYYNEPFIYAGQTKTIQFQYLRGNDRSNYLDEIYLISPYGDPYTNIKVAYNNGHVKLPGYNRPQPLVSEIDGNYPEGDGSFHPTQAFIDKYPKARVYKLDFTNITEIHEMYLTRQYGITDVTAKARNEDEMPIDGHWASRLDISFTMAASRQDPGGTTPSELMRVKVWRPDDLTNVVFRSDSGQDWVNDIYNLTGDTSTKLNRYRRIRIIPEEEVQVIPAVKQTTEPSSMYRTWDETENTIVRCNHDLDYRLEILNTSTSIAKGVEVYIPIPKEGEFWGTEFQKTEEPFGYDLSLAGPVTLPDNYEVSYVKNADPSNQHETWNGYDWATDVSGWTDADWDEVNFVKIVYNGDTGISTGEDVFAYMSMHTSEYSETDLANDVQNIWRPYYLRELSGVSAFRTGETVATALMPAKISGTVFEDLKNDGTYDPEDSELPDTGIESVTVEAWREVDGELTKITSTETDENGDYLFDTLIEGKQYTIIVKNPDTDTYFKFSVNGPAATRFAPEQDQSQAAAAETAKVAETGNHMEVDCGLLQELKVPVTKIWADGTNQDGVRPESIQVKLKGTVEADPEDTDSEEKTVVEKTQTLTAENADEEDETGNTWIYTFKGLTAYEKGKEISYSVEETKTAVITGTDGPGTYKLDVQGSVEDGFEITSTHTPEVRDITVTKAWEDFDNMNSTRPDSISVQLYAGGTASGDPVSISGSGSWTHTWTGVYKFKDGSEINYTVDEAGAIPSYRKADTIGGSMTAGFTITNTLVVTTADAQKLWSNADGTTTAPVGAKVTFTLYADDEETGFTVELDGTADTAAPTVTGGYESEPWKASFVNLPKYKAGTDTEVEYTIAETSGYTGYTASPAEPVASGGSITNTQDVTSLKVTKVWEDAGDQDGKRPETITVKLLDGKDEIKSQDIEIDRDTDRYEHTFTSLPIYVTDEEGVQHKAVYSVAEEKITTGDYSAAYDTIKAEEKEIEIQITNSYTPEQTSVTVDKVWDDANDQDALRPESIQVQLYNGDTAVREPVTLTAEEGWTYTWTELDKYSPHGKEIKYSVKEVEPVPEYEAEIKEIDDTNKIIINNKHEVHKTEVTVSKVWEDNDNTTGARPAELLVTLYADGEAVEETALNEKNSWKHTFENLDVNKIVDGKGGNAIVYTVEEEKVNAYYGEITKTEEEKGITYTIKNTYAPAKHDPPVKKVITGDKPVETETFYFTLTPVSNTAGLDEMPMPEGSSGSSKTVTVTGEGETEIGIITFNAPGQYIYRVVETAGSNSNYTYDGSTYQIIYDVTEGENSLQASRKYLKDGKEVEEIVFTNEYKEPTKPSEPSKPSKLSKHSRSNNTGDSANGALWALMLLLAAGFLL